MAITYPQVNAAAPAGSGTTTMTAALLTAPAEGSLILVALEVDDAGVTITANPSSVWIPGPTVTNGANEKYYTWIKPARDSEPASWNWTTSAAWFSGRALVMEIAGADVNTPFDVAGSATYKGFVGSYTTDGLTTVTNGADHILLHHDKGSTGNDVTPPAGYTERADTGWWVATKTITTAGATGTFTITVDSWYIGAFSIAIRPRLPRVGTGTAGSGRFRLRRSTGGSTLKGGHTLKGTDGGVTVTRDVTADAATGLVATRDVTADAADSMTATRSVTADAAISMTATRDVTADAAVSQAATRDLTSDAAVGTTGTRDLTSDAAVSRTLSRDVTADAVTTVIVSRDLSGDAAVSMQATRDLTSDAAVSQTATRDLTADASTAAPSARDLTADAAVGVTVTRDLTADAAVSMQATRDVTADASTAAPSARDLTADAAVSQAATRDLTSDAAVGTTGTRDLTSDAAAGLGAARDITADAAVGVTATRDLTADAVTNAQATRDLTSDAAVSMQASRDLTSDAAVSTTGIRDVLADAAVGGSINRDVTSDAAVSMTAGQSVTSDAAVSRTLSRDVTADAATGLSATRDLTSDAAVAFTATRDLTSDAAVSVQVGRSVTSDAAVSMQALRDILADAAVGLSAMMDLTATAAVSVVTTRDLTMDAAVAQPAHIDVTADAVTGLIKFRDVTADSANGAPAHRDLDMDAAVSHTWTRDVSATAAVSITPTVIIGRDWRRARVRLYNGSYASNPAGVTDATPYPYRGAGSDETLIGNSHTLDLSVGGMQPDDGTLLVVTLSWSASVTITIPTGFTQAVKREGAGGARGAIYYKTWATGDALTYTWGFSANVSGYFRYQAFTGLAVASVLDKTVSNTASLTGARGYTMTTGATTTLAQASELVIELFVTGEALATITPLPTEGYQSLGSNVKVPSVQSEIGGWRTTTTTAAQSGSATVPAENTYSGDWVAMAATFKASGSPVTKFNPIGDFDAIEGSATMRMLELGDMSIAIPTADPLAAQVKESSIFEFWIPQGMTGYSFGWYRVDHLTRESGPGGRLRVKGLDLRAFIYERAMQSATITSVRGSVGTTDVETWVRGYVTATAITLAGTPYTTPVAGLALESTNGHRGTTYATSPAETGKPLGETIKKLLGADNLGCRVVINGAGTSSGVMEFQTYTPTNRTLGQATPALFATQFDTATEVNTQGDAVGALNAITALGKPDTAGTRQAQYFADASSIAKWGLRYSTVDMSNDPDGTAGGAVYLYNRKPKALADVTPRPNSTLMPFVDYFLGDSVTAISEDKVRIDGSITEVNLSLTGQAESVFGDMAPGVPATADLPLAWNPDRGRWNPIFMVIGLNPATGADGGAVDESQAGTRDYTYLPGLTKDAAAINGGITLVEGVTPGTPTASKALILNGSGQVSSFSSSGTITGVGVTATGAVQGDDVNAITNLKIAGVNVAATAAELSRVGGVTPGTTTPSKAVIPNSSGVSDALTITALKAGAGANGNLQDGATYNPIQAAITSLAGDGSDLAVDVALKVNDILAKLRLHKTIAP